jgi:hypothetical protein
MDILLERRLVRCNTPSATRDRAGSEGWVLVLLSNVVECNGE